MELNDNMLKMKKLSDICKIKFEYSDEKLQKTHDNNIKFITIGFPLIILVFLFGFSINALSLYWGFIPTSDEEIVSYIIVLFMWLFLISQIVRIFCVISLAKKEASGAYLVFKNKKGYLKSSVSKNTRKKLLSLQALSLFVVDISLIFIFICFTMEAIAFYASVKSGDFYTDNHNNELLSIGILILVLLVSLLVFIFIGFVFSKAYSCSSCKGTRVKYPFSRYIGEPPPF